MNRSLQLLLVIALGLFTTGGVMAQKQENQLSPRYHIELKINAPVIAVGVINFGVEVGFCEHSAVELSNTTSFNKGNFMGSSKPLILNMTMLEYRYYFNKSPYKGFFIGADVAWNVFKMHKSIIPGYMNDGLKREYDWGFGTTLGATFGYKFQIAERWFIEPSISAGWQLTQHEPHANDQVTCPMNASGEWLIYKAGVYLTFRL